MSCNCEDKSFGKHSTGCRYARWDAEVMCHFCKQKSITCSWLSEKYYKGGRKLWLACRDHIETAQDAKRDFVKYLKENRPELLIGYVPGVHKDNL